jgi:hypothetical protein
MAKFKVGDKVRDTEAMRDGVIVEVDAEKPGYYAVKYDTRPQPQWNIPESYLTAANSAPVSANSVVRNAMAARTARNAIDFNGASAKVQKAFEGRIDKLVQKFKNDLRAVSTDVAKEYKKYKGIEPDSATLILEVGDWIESLKGSVDDSW